jgi:hypothetical protein
VKISALVCALFCLFMATKSADAQDLVDLRHITTGIGNLDKETEKTGLTKQSPIMPAEGRVLALSLSDMVLVALKHAGAVMAQPAAGRKRLTVVCYWQNFAEVERGRLSANYLLNRGCEKYKDPTHCKRTAPEMLSDTKHDWERVIADDVIYTIRCKRNCKKIPSPSQSYEAETDGKFMWITFLMPDNMDKMVTFEILDISPAKKKA